MALFAAVAASLTGQQMTDLPARTPEQIVAALGRQGWSASVIASHRDRVIESGRRWPHPIDPRLRDGVGAAQVAAVVSAVTQLLNLGGPSRLRQANTVPDARDRELIAQVPPHHGRIG